METIDLIYEVFEEIRKAEENQDSELLEKKKKQLEDLRSDLAHGCVNRKAPAPAVEKLLLGRRIS
jgi:hypothetical protein